MNLTALREEVLEANLALVRRGLVIFTFGNASGYDAESGRVVIKPSGVPYDKLTLPVGVVTPWPDRVVAFTTRLVLSPYSAGGAPVITSTEAIAFSGIDVENCLLC